MCDPSNRHAPPVSDSGHRNANVGVIEEGSEPILERT
jgi:hypothetical protein